jgi:hypothetical protein
MKEEKRQPSRLVFRSKPPAKPEPPPSEEERLRHARERASEYRNPQPVVDADGEAITEMDEWADLVSKRIEEAMRRGDFENLRGQGKPMRLEQEPFVPEEQQMANRILKNNDMTPNWIAERKEMLRALESWRAEFQRIVGEAQRAWGTASDDARRVQVRESWARWLARWEDEIVDLNRRIGTFNLKQPITHLEIFKLRLDDELRKVGMTRHLE